jgi:hypothetical protein
MSEIVRRIVAIGVLAVAGVMLAVTFLGGQLGGPRILDTRSGGPPSPTPIPAEVLTDGPPTFPRRWIVGP